MNGITLHFSFQCYLWSGNMDLSFHDRDPPFEILFYHCLKGEHDRFVRRGTFLDRVYIEHETLVEFLIGRMNDTLTDEHVARAQLERRIHKC